MDGLSFEAFGDLKGLDSTERLPNGKGAIMTNKRLQSYAKAAALSAVIVATASGLAFAADIPVKAAPKVKEVPFFFVNDTSVSFTWYFNATNPGVAGSADTVPGGIAGQKSTFFRATGEIDHFDVWEYGTILSSSRRTSTAIKTRNWESLVQMVPENYLHSREALLVGTS